MLFYALIKNDVVENTIKINDASFIDRIAGNFDTTIDISNEIPRPSIGWEYVGGTFVAPIIPVIPETPEGQEARERGERIKAVAVDPAAIPMAGVPLQDLLKDILDSL